MSQENSIENEHLKEKPLKFQYEPMFDRLKKFGCKKTTKNSYLQKITLKSD